MPAPKWRTWAFLLGSREGLQAQASPPPAPSATYRRPRFAGCTTGPGLGRPTHGGPPPHGHPAPREPAREGGAQAGRATLPPRGGARMFTCLEVGS